jgi:hypothetical protein
MRKKTGSNDQVPALAGSAVSSTAFRKNWARLIHKIYQIDPLLCPKYQGPIKVIANKWAKPQLFAPYAMSDRSLLVPLLSGFNSGAGQPSWPHSLLWGQEG